LIVAVKVGAGVEVAVGVEVGVGVSDGVSVAVFVGRAGFAVAVFCLASSAKVNEGADVNEGITERKAVKTPRGQADQIKTQTANRATIPAASIHGRRLFFLAAGCLAGVFLILTALPGGNGREGRAASRWRRSSARARALAASGLPGLSWSACRA
jgi:hypothetical protein